MFFFPPHLDCAGPGDGSDIEDDAYADFDDADLDRLQRQISRFNSDVSSDSGSDDDNDAMSHLGPRLRPFYSPEPEETRMHRRSSSDSTGIPTNRRSSRRSQSGHLVAAVLSTHVVRFGLE